MESRIFHVHVRTKGTDSGGYLFIAGVCPAAGEPDLKTSPPIKWKHRDLSEWDAQT